MRSSPGCPLGSLQHRRPSLVGGACWASRGRLARRCANSARARTRCHSLAGRAKVTVMAGPRSRSDVELLGATPTDREAFAEFYRRHERAILGFFVHWCRSPELAADLTAETFAGAFESVSRYEAGRGEPRALRDGGARLPAPPYSQRRDRVDLRLTDAPRRSIASTGSSPTAVRTVIQGRYVKGGNCLT